MTKADGTVLRTTRSPAGKQVLNPAIAETVTDTAPGPDPGRRHRGGARLAGFGRPVGRQDGHHQRRERRLVRGLHPAAVDRGVDGPRRRRSSTLRLRGVGEVFGGTVPAKAWGDFMKPAVANLPPLDFPKPGPLPPPNSAADAAAALDPSSRRANTPDHPPVVHRL